MYKRKLQSQLMYHQMVFYFVTSEYLHEFAWYVIAVWYAFIGFKPLGGLKLFLFVVAL